MRDAIRHSIALLAAFALAGCYNYSPIEVGNVTPGMEVRARVSAPTAARIAPSLNMSDARLLNGEVVENQADGLTLKVPSAPAGTVGAPEGLFQQILIGRTDVLEIEFKQLDRTRTGVLIGTGVVVAAAAIVVALQGRSSGEGPITEPPPSFTIGVFRFQLGHLPSARPRHGPR